MKLSEISRSGWHKIVLLSVSILSILVFCIAYFGISSTVPTATEYGKVMVAVTITAIIVLGGIGSFFAITYRKKVIEAMTHKDEELEE
jgi:hypothetical protein